MAAKRRTGQTTRSRRRSGGQSLPGWLWGLGGLTAGLFVALLVHLNQGPAPTAAEGLDALFADRREDGDATDEASADPARDKPTFEFYRLLPEQEVAIPDAEPQTPPMGEEPPAPDLAEEDPERDEPASGDRAGSTPSPRTDGRFLLQAGSFRGADDADRLKASLALLGVEAQVQEVELTGGEVWHRVRIGPFADQNEINAVRGRLKENDVETILLKAGG